MKKSASIAVTVEMLTQTTLTEGCIPHFDRIDWISVSASPPAGFTCGSTHGSPEVQVSWTDFIDYRTGCFISKTTRGRIICYPTTGAVSGPAIYMRDDIRVNRITVYYR